MTDYRVGKNGMFVTMLTEKASQRIGSRVLLGWSLSFKSVVDTAEYVRSSEVEGYTFEGKEALAIG
jgi:hypothetical protein